MESTDYSVQFEAAVDKAADAGFIVHRSTPRHLLVDLDDGKQLNDLVFEILRRRYGAKLEHLYTSKDGKGHHAIISLPVDYDLPVRAAFQAALGDDPVRNVLAVNNWHKGVEEPFLLFEPTSVSPKGD